MNILDLLALIFLALLGFLIFKNRKFVKREGIFILWRTNLGIKIMDKIANKLKNKKFVEFFVYLMVFFSFVFSFLIIIYLLKHTISLIKKETEIPGVSLIIPGVTEVAGLKIPFWTILIIFIVALVHEFAHGLFARIYNMKVKSTGLVLLAIIPGAFVEIDEKLLEKKKLKEKLAIISAGPFFNILLAIMSFGLVLLVNKIPVTYTGVYYQSYNNSELSKGILYEINGKILIYSNLKEAISLIKEEIKNKKEIRVIIKENDNFKEKIVPVINKSNNFKLGVYLSSSCDLSTDYALCNVREGLYQFLFFLFLFNIGIGTANLLPIIPLDGGKMWYFILKNKMPLFIFLNIITLLVLLLNLFFPLIKRFI